MASVVSTSAKLSSSAYSRKYAMNTSVVANNLNNVNVLNENPKEVTPQMSLEAISMDVGRCDFTKKFVSRFRAFVILFFLIVNSFGGQILISGLSDDGNDKLLSTTFDVIYAISAFQPADASFYVRLIVDLPILIVILAIVFYTVLIVKKYSKQDAPTDSQIYFWLFIVRDILPIFNLYSAMTFGSSLYEIIFQDSDDALHEDTTYSIAILIITLFTIVAQIALVIFTSTVYNSTPIFRKNDITQLWYAFSHFDFQINYILYISVIVQELLRIVAHEISIYIYAAISCVCYIFTIYYIFVHLPYVNPTMNGIFLGCLTECALLSFFPIICHYTAKNGKESVISYLLLVYLVVLILLIFMWIFIVTSKMNSILTKFAMAMPQKENNDDEDINNNFYMNNILGNKSKVYADYELLDVTKPSELSDLMRVGFLYNLDDVIDLHYVDWAVKNCSKTEILLCAVQIAFETQTNQQYLQAYQQCLQTASHLPLNSKSFTTLLNDLRQETLTQYNKPLLNAIGKAKKSNSVLLNTIHDFWGAVLKQRSEIMMNLIPQISREILHTERLYQSLLRHYPSSNLALREVSTFTHTSIGDHKQMIRYQAKLNETQKSMAGDDIDLGQEGTMSLDMMTHELDKAYMQRIEPWIAAQDFVENMPSKATRMLNVSIILMIVMMFFIPTFVFAFGMTKQIEYNKSIDPIELIGNTLYAIVRIPQLARRKNLFAQNKIIVFGSEQWPYSTGPPLETLLEFLNESSILGHYESYTTQLKEAESDLLLMCKTNSKIGSVCEKKQFEKTSGNSTQPATPFDLLNTFANSAEGLLGISDTQSAWAVANKDQNMVTMFSNFDNLFGAIESLLAVQVDDVLQKTDYFKKLQIIFYVIIWGIPLVIITPLLLVSLFLIRKEIKQILNLFPSISKSTISNLRWSISTKISKKKIPGNQKNAKNPNASTSMDSDGSTINEGGNTTQVMCDQVIESLATVPRNLHGLFSTFLLSTYFFIIFSCLLASVGVIVFNGLIADSMNFANAYIESLNVTSSCLASYIWTQELFSDDPLIPFSRRHLKLRSQYYAEQLLINFNSMLFGKAHSDFTPGILLGKEIITHFEHSKSTVNLRSSEFTPLYGMLHDVYFSMSCDAQMRLFDDIVRFVLNATDETPINHFNFSDDFVYHYEHILFAHLDGFFHRGSTILYNNLIDNNQTQTYNLVLVFVILYVIQILFLLLFYIDHYKEFKHNLWTVKHLLVLVPPEVLLKTQNVIKYLSGSVNSNRNRNSNDADPNSKKYSEEFIVNSSKCALIITSDQLTITQTNTMALNYLKEDMLKFNNSADSTSNEKSNDKGNDKSDEVDASNNYLIGKNFRNCLTSIIVDKEKFKVISKFDEEIKKMKSGRHKTNVHVFYTSILGHQSQANQRLENNDGQNETTAANQLIFIGLTLVGHSQDSSIGSMGMGHDEHERMPATAFSITLADRTAEHYQEALVESEKKKSEKLIQSLLHPSIIQRLNDGETDISFEVQQATVLFSSVVRWTELIANWDAVRVMKFLNALFSKYDELLHEFPAITKVKTIGHIYMIAGGIFNDSSVNSAAVVTNYAVKMLEIVKKLNEELKIDFTITAGINTGGPINCGILGHTRPVFDILGDVVNVSSRMNSFSLPGYIQISEATYNGIKYLDFNIRERGEIMIKGKGKMKTYLVSMPAKI